MHNFFEKKGWVCGEFLEFEGVLKAVKSTIYYLYIIDINLPESDGIAFLKELRQK